MSTKCDVLCHWSGLETDHSQLNNVATMLNVMRQYWEWSIAGDEAVLNCDDHFLLCRCETRWYCRAKKEGTFYLLHGEVIVDERGDVKSSVPGYWFMLAFMISC